MFGDTTGCGEALLSYRYQARGNLRDMRRPAMVAGGQNLVDKGNPQQTLLPACKGELFNARKVVGEVSLLTEPKVRATPRRKAELIYGRWCPEVSCSGIPA